MTFLSKKEIRIFIERVYIGNNVYLEFYNDELLKL